MCKEWLYFPSPGPTTSFTHAYTFQRNAGLKTEQSTPSGETVLPLRYRAVFRFRPSPEINHALGTSISCVTTFDDTSWHRASATVFGESFSKARVCQQWNSLDQHHFHSRLGREEPAFQISLVAHGPQHTAGIPLQTQGTITPETVPYTFFFTCSSFQSPICISSRYEPLLFLTV